MDKGELSYLSLLADFGKKELLTSYLQSSFDRRKPSPANDSGSLTGKLENLTAAVEYVPEICWLLELWLLSQCLVFKKEVSEDAGFWIRRHVDSGRYLSDMDWDLALSGTWQLVPVLLVLSKVYIRHFVVGFIPDRSQGAIWPDWADALMDTAAKDAIRTAAEAACRIYPPQPDTGLFCYPLTAGSRSIQFKGKSLGLPLALGFAGALTGLPPVVRVPATGAIEKNGSVPAIGHLQEKISFAGQKNYRGMIFPAANEPPAVPEGLDALPVSDLQEAHLFASLYSPGKSDRLIQLPGMLEDPQLFVARCNTLDPRWVKWAFRQGKLQKMMDQVLSSVELFTALAARLEECLNSWELEKARALAGTVPPVMLSNAIRTAPLAAFKWSTLNLSLANHDGNVCGAAGWVYLAESFEDEILRSDVKALAEYYNHKLVHHHNRYHFDPRLSPPLKKILESLERPYREQCRTGCKTDAVLGRLYGSISQNFAFCGPQHLKRVEHYSMLARTALGEGAAADFKKEWMRQLNYITYAYLDAGRFPEAEKSLLDILEAKTWPEIWRCFSRLNRWQHALLIRFLADTRKQKQQKAYLDRAVRHKFDFIEKHHPWQLWAFNIARVAGSLNRFETAFEFYTESLDLCFGEHSGPTVIVMAMLPLSGLQQLGQLDTIDLQATEKRVKEAAQTLDRYHFKILDTDNFKAILAKIWQNPQTLFPFTYR